MGTMGDLGQMGQMMRRNGNVFQMLPIKKNGKIWQFSKTVGKGSPKSNLNFFIVFLQEKLPQNGKKGQIG